MCPDDKLRKRCKDMNRERSKKMIALYIFDILKRYTDEEHTLSQKQIETILEEEYDIVAERKAIHRYIMELKDFLEVDIKDEGYGIGYFETLRMMPARDEKTNKILINPKTGERVMEKNFIKSDFYLKRPFSEGELRLLVDSLVFSPHVSGGQCKKMAKKISGLSNERFNAHIQHIACLPEDICDNKELFKNIKMLDCAISKNRKVSFNYMEYGTDKKQRAKRGKDGKDKVYIISPYQMAANEGKYYLICNNDDYNDISNFRIDRIRNVKILDEIAKPYETLEWAEGRRLDLATYMKEHIYMYSSENVRVKFKVVHAMVSDVMDIFGKDVRFLDKDEKYVTVSSKTNEMAMLQFAKRHIPDVVVLEPQGLRDKVREELEKAVREYEEEE